MAGTVGTIDENSAMQYSFTYIGILVAVLLILAHFGREHTIIDSRNLLGCEADYIHVGLERPVDLKVMKVTARRSEDDDTFVG